MKSTYFLGALVLVAKSGMGNGSRGFLSGDFISLLVGLNFLFISSFC